MDFSSTETFPQLLLSIIIVAAVFFIYMILETLYRAYLGYSGARIAVYPVTGNKTKVIKQDPKAAGAITLPPSENQLTGIEFSYSCFLYISEDTETGEEGWATIFYKGYESGPFPLLGPGLFISTNSSGTGNTTGSPTLRVIMNTYDNWFNPIDVNQFPLNKWVHVGLVLRKNAMEVYINGNLANKKNFAGTLPYQNYQPLNLFPNTKTSSPDSQWKSTATEQKKGIPVGENFIVKGKASGYISNLYYFSYAMTYSEIQAMMAMGPSEEFDQGSMDKPPYLIDSWWTQRRS